MDFLMDFLIEVLRLVPPVVPAAMLIYLLVDAAKRLGLPDGRAGQLSLALNVLAWGGMYIARAQGLEENTLGWLAWLTDLAELLLPAALSVAATKGFYLFGQKIGIAKKHT